MPMCAVVGTKVAGTRVEPPRYRLRAPTVTAAADLGRSSSAQPTHPTPPAVLTRAPSLPTHPTPASRKPAVLTTAPLAAGALAEPPGTLNGAPSGTLNGARPLVPSPAPRGVAAGRLAALRRVAGNARRLGCVDVGFMSRVAREEARDEAAPFGAVGFMSRVARDEVAPTGLRGDGSSEARPGSSVFDETVEASEVSVLAGGMWGEVAVGARLELSMV